jgi:hypothetical protein
MARYSELYIGLFEDTLYVGYQPSAPTFSAYQYDPYARLAKAVLKIAGGIEMKGKGTKAEPYLISDKYAFAVFSDTIRYKKDNYKGKYFKQTADIDMSGIKLYVNDEAEANFFRFGNISPDIYPGMNHLNGEQALAYSRIRKLDMDAMRAGRQRKVLTALINAYKSKPLGEMITLATEILDTEVNGHDMIQTDMTSNEVIEYVKTLFPMLATATINNQQIPANGTYTEMTVGKISATKVCDLETNRKILQQILGN